MDTVSLPTGEALNEALATVVLGYHRLFDSIQGELWATGPDEAPMDECPDFCTDEKAFEPVVAKLKALDMWEAYEKNLAEMTAGENAISMETRGHAALQAVKTNRTLFK